MENEIGISRRKFLITGGAGALGVAGLATIGGNQLGERTVLQAQSDADPFAGHGEAAATGTDDQHAASDTTEAQGDDHATTTADAGHAPAADATQGTAPEGAIFMHPDNHVMDDAHHAPAWVKVSPFIAMLIGLATAFWFYIVNPEMPRRLAEMQRPLYLFLLNKWYFDEIYEFLFVNPAKAIGRFLWKRGDGDVIDGTLNGVAMGAVPWFTRLAGRAQSGYIFTYAFAMVIGVVVLITWMVLSGGAR